MNKKTKAKIKNALSRVGLDVLIKRLIWENRDALQVLACRFHYARHLRRIRSKPSNEKIRVLFIVSEIAKWKEQSVYEAMERSGVFEPIVGLSAWNRQLECVISNDQLLQVHAKAETFFDRLGDRHVRTVRVENGERVFCDLSEFKPDVIYFTEPWGACPKQDVGTAARIALTFYTPYYVSNYDQIDQECHLPFHHMLYGYFCLGQFWKKAFEKSLRGVVHADKILVTGHPALDYFYEQRNRKPVKDYVIYAPHFSFPHPKHRWLPQAYSTFNWNGREILSYAKAHPGINWVFKPHPVLRREILETGLMSRAEMDEYYAEWGRVGLVCEDGDYQNLFIESRAMITDCGSFLTEYGSTGRPVIHLICPDNVRQPSKITGPIYDTYYQVHDLDEMYKVFQTVLEKRLDPRRELRMKMVGESGLAKANAAQEIVKYLRGLFDR